MKDDNKIIYTLPFRITCLLCALCVIALTMTHPEIDTTSGKWWLIGFSVGFTILMGLLMYGSWKGDPQRAGKKKVWELWPEGIELTEKHPLQLTQKEYEELLQGYRWMYKKIEP